jgi:hypothetical protein
MVWIKKSGDDLFSDFDKKNIDFLKKITYNLKNVCHFFESITVLYADNGS